MPLTSDGKQNLAQTMASLGSYFSLHTAQPSQAAPHEVSGTGYARVAIVGASTSGGVISITAINTLTVPANVTVAYIGIWDALTGGNLAAYSQVTAEKCNAQGQFRINPGTLFTVA
jgi:L-serine deaminase